jgi:hypothetical protein
MLKDGGCGGFVMLSARALLSGCGAAIFERPCPRVTEFPGELQQQAAVELATAPALAHDGRDSR